MCPCGGYGLGGLIPKEVVCHCLLIETEKDLILVDTGLGTEDIKDPKRLGLMANMLGVDTRKALPALEHLKNLGFSQKDVTHIIPTHLDLDHAGGIIDFPNATIHVSANE